MRSYIMGVLIASLGTSMAMAQGPRFQRPPSREQRQEQRQQQRDNRPEPRRSDQPSDRGRFNPPINQGSGQRSDDRQRGDDRQRDDRQRTDDRQGGDRGNPAGARDGDWLRRHSGLPLQEQQRALESDPAFRQLPPQQQDRLRDRLQKFNSLPPDRRETILHRKDVWERLNPQQRDQARDLFQRFRGMPEDRRKSMALALRALRNRPPQDRQNLLDSDRFRNSFSPDEIEVLRGMTDLNIGPGHGNEDGGPQD